MIQKVMRFKTYERLDTLVPRHNAFSFREDRPYHWLQRLCLWGLRKIGAWDQERVSTFNYLDIDVEASRAGVLRMLHSLGVHKEDAGRLYCGREFFFELINDCRREHSDFIFMHSEKFDAEIFGIPVIVVPWMEGALITPAERP